MRKLLTETPLCELAFKYGSDKCPRIKHFYTQFYYELFKDRRDSVKKVLEIGVGYPEDVKHAASITTYITGASLYMWRDFFPSAMIYGADVVDECMFTADRIETFICNQNHERDLRRLLGRTGRDIDFFIDDGSHMTSDQVYTAMVLLPRLQDSVIYCIEDMRESRAVLEGISKAYPEYKYEIIARGTKYRDDKILVIRKK